MISLIPARWAAITFSLIPPTGNTMPDRVISRSSRGHAESVFGRCGCQRGCDGNSAEGPSPGTAPAGDVKMDFVLFKNPPECTGDPDEFGPENMLLWQIPSSTHPIFS